MTWYSCWPNVPSSEKHDNSSTNTSVCVCVYITHSFKSPLLYIKNTWVVNSLAAAFWKLFAVTGVWKQSVWQGWNSCLLSGWQQVLASEMSWHWGMTMSAQRIPCAKPSWLCSSQRLVLPRLLAEECGKCRLNFRNRQRPKADLIWTCSSCKQLVMLWFELIMFSLVSLMFCPLTSLWQGDHCLSLDT